MIRTLARTCFSRLNNHACSSIYKLIWPTIKITKLLENGASVQKSAKPETRADSGTTIRQQSDHSTLFTKVIDSYYLRRLTARLEVTALFPHASFNPRWLMDASHYADWAGEASNAFKIPIERLCDLPSRSAKYNIVSVFNCRDIVDARPRYFVFSSPFFFFNSLIKTRKESRERGGRRRRGKVRQ